MVLMDDDVAFDIVYSYDVDSLHVERNKINNFSGCHLYSIYRFLWFYMS